MQSVETNGYLTGNKAQERRHDQRFRFSSSINHHANPRIDLSSGMLSGIDFKI